MKLGADTVQVANVVKKADTTMVKIKVATVMATDMVAAAAADKNPFLSKNKHIHFQSIFLPYFNLYVWLIYYCLLF